MVCHACSLSNLGPWRKTEKLLTFWDWQVSLPFLVLHGGDDIVTDPLVSKLLFEEASSGDKDLKLYPGMWHALMAEFPQDAERVYSDIISWLDQRANCAANVSANTGTASA